MVDDAAETRFVKDVVAVEENPAYIKIISIV